MLTTETPKETKTIKVMIVEDYKLTRVGLKFAMSEYEGIDVVSDVESGEECIELVKFVKPDVILMDMGLPVMNGLEASMKIKQMYPNIKIIMLTSHMREEEVTAAIGSGATGYCLKDINPNTLKDVIKSVNNGACYIDPNVTKYIVKTFPKPKSTDLSGIEDKNSSKWQLTEREAEVLRLLVEGKSNNEIADVLYVSVHTAKAHVCNILQKLCVDDRVQAAVLAVKEGLV